MLSLAQWKTSRRVDHVNIPGIPWHPRYRGRNTIRPDLKMFDPFVQRHETCVNPVDRVNALGEIIDLATGFLSISNDPTVLARYLAPVQALRAAAIQDLRARVGTAYVDGASRDIIALANGGALTPKRIPVNLFWVAPRGAPPDAARLGAITTAIAAQVTAANQCAGYRAAMLTVVPAAAAPRVLSESPAHESLLLAGDQVPVAMRGRFQEAGRGGVRLIQTLNTIPGTGVDVVFVERMEADDVQGFTFRTSKGHPLDGAVQPERPIVLVRETPAAGGAGTHPTTLAHELCHAISDEGEHSADPKNLMSAGSARDGTNALGPGQIGWYRNNAYAAA